MIYDHFKNNWKKYNIQNIKKYNFTEDDKKIEECEVSGGFLNDIDVVVTPIENNNNMNNMIENNIQPLIDQPPVIMNVNEVAE